MKISLPPCGPRRDDWREKGAGGVNAHRIAKPDIADMDGPPTRTSAQERRIGVSQ